MTRSIISNIELTISYVHESPKNSPCIQDTYVQWNSKICYNVKAFNVCFPLNLEAKECKRNIREISIEIESIIVVVLKWLQESYNSICIWNQELNIEVGKIAVTNVPNIIWNLGYFNCLLFFLPSSHLLGFIKFILQLPFVFTSWHHKRPETCSTSNNLLTLVIS